MMTHHITREQFAEAVSEGLNLRHMAIRFDVGVNTIQNWEGRFGLKCRRDYKRKLLVRRKILTQTKGDIMKNLRNRIRSLIIKHVDLEMPGRPLLRDCFWQSIELDEMIDELVSRSKEYLTGTKHDL